MYQYLNIEINFIYCKKILAGVLCYLLLLLSVVIKLDVSTQFAQMMTKDKKQENMSDDEIFMNNVKEVVDQQLLNDDLRNKEETVALQSSKYKCSLALVI